MQIWVDADACPKVIKEILFRAADRRGPPTLSRGDHQAFGNLLDKFLAKYGSH